MDELERRQPSLPFDELSQNRLQAFDTQPIVDVSPEEVPHLLDYWAIILKRRWVVLACLVVVFTTVAIGTLKEKPVYQGKVLVEIDPEPPSVVNFKEVVSVNPVDVDAYLETQYKILKSRTLAQQVVDDLQLYRIPEFYTSRGIFGLIQSTPKVLPKSTDPNPDINSTYYRNSVAHTQNFLDISPVRRSNLVQLSFDSYSPEIAARVANKIAQTYIQQNLDVKWQETTSASNWLKGKLVDLQAALEKSQNALQAYAQSHNILYVTDKQNLAAARMTDLLTEYSKAQGDMFQQEGLYSLVKQGKTEDLPGVLSNALIQNLEEKLADDKAKYAEITSWVKPNYPKAREMQRQIAGMQKQIDKQKAAIVHNIQDEYNSSQHRVKYLSQAIDDQRKLMNEIARKSVQYDILKQAVDSNTQLYQGMLQRMKEAQVSAGLSASNIRIVDTAVVPKGPVKPRIMLNLALGLILGLGFGVGLAFFQEYLDKTLKSSDDVERLLRLPSLGILPKFALNGNGAHLLDDGDGVE
ncbi:MAG: GumC family protein, partial [Terriglobia bacterium]